MIPTFPHISVKYLGICKEMHVPFEEILTFYRKAGLGCNVTVLGLCFRQVALNQFYRKSHTCHCFGCLLCRPPVSSFPRTVHRGVVSGFSCLLLAKLRPSQETRHQWTSCPVRLIFRAIWQKPPSQSKGFGTGLPKTGHLGVQMIPS